MKQLLIDEMENLLKSNILNVWYPRSVDKEFGGFLSDFSYDWQESGIHLKKTVTQARHIWTLSNVSEFFNDDYYKEIAAHGVKFLKEVLWDSQYGGLE